MKTLLILLTTLAFINTKGQTLNQTHQNEDGKYFSIGLNPRILIDSIHLDNQIRIGYKKNRFEAFISYEMYSIIGYTFYSIGGQYMIVNSKVSLLAGIEVGGIHRDNSVNKFSKWGVNIEPRYKISKNARIYWTLNIKDRPDLNGKGYVFSTYLGIIDYF